MYEPEHFKEERLGVQQALIKAHPFGLLISNGAEGLEANAVPFILDAAAAPLGILRAHVARANPHWKSLTGKQVLVVFQGPQTYISPSLYETKRETGKVVPTWNYVMVQYSSSRSRAVSQFSSIWVTSVECIFRAASRSASSCRTAAIRSRMTGSCR